MSKETQELNQLKASIDSLLSEMNTCQDNINTGQDKAVNTLIYEDMQTQLDFMFGYERILELRIRRGKYKKG